MYLFRTNILKQWLHVNQTCAIASWCYKIFIHCYNILFIHVNLLINQSFIYSLVFFISSMNLIRSGYIPKKGYLKKKLNYLFGTSYTNCKPIVTYELLLQQKVYSCRWIPPKDVFAAQYLACKKDSSSVNPPHKVVIPSSRKGLTSYRAFLLLEDVSAYAQISIGKRIQHEIDPYYRYNLNKL